jgi:small subunit ribosomal protein S17
MAEKKKTQEKKPENYSDKLCPVHGDQKLKTRGRTFQGEVIRKLHKKVTIQFERMISVPKYERYEKRRTKIHARLPEYLEREINVGDRIEIAETRPISKTIHFVVTKLVRKKNQ